ncbi:hypothetical protein NP493_419g02004 [Ridgeia piscesae]|uniref:Uncharacterized protein n=1 Tax=Ridgeia piscesae TaxID=27915 RepID=A0AAD9NUA5_RIDPI|nr:hypothetical protein NP493_419g02004 [Ridgeia piscesae]
MELTQLIPAMTTAPTTTRHPSCENQKRRFVIAAFVGVVCLGYFCVMSKDRSVTPKSQSNVAWQTSQTQSTFNDANMATKKTFHPEPMNRIKMGKLTRLSDKSANNVTENGNKRALIFTSRLNQKETSRNISDLIHMVNILAEMCVRACAWLYVNACTIGYVLNTLHLFSCHPVYVRFMQYNSRLCTPHELHQSVRFIFHIDLQFGCKKKTNLFLFDP